MALAQETVVATQVEVQRYSYQAVSLTNFTSDTLEPALAAGSRVEIGGALFVAAGDESITGWAGIAVSNDVYIKLTVSGASATASFTTTAPTWSTSKQGFYDAGETDRYIGGLYKDGSGNYARKWMYEEKQIASVKRYGSGAVELTGALYGSGYGAALVGESGLKIGAADTALLRKVIDIGDWNMDTTNYVDVAHGLADTSKVRFLRVSIRQDPNYEFTNHPLEAGGYGKITPGGNVRCTRTESGMFDDPNFDATSFNRGWIIIEYEP